MAWTITEEQKTVIHLYQDDMLILNGSGKPFEFDSREHAEHVAAHWEEHRAPTWAELRGMSDEALIKRAGCA